MKTTLKLGSLIFNPVEAKEILGRVVRENTLELEAEIKRSMADSVPRGRLYRRGRITRAATKALKREKFRTFKTAKGNERAIVGYKFHRASAPGQVPAIDTGHYINSIHSDTTQAFKGRVSTNAAQANKLEKTRPHFKPALDKQTPKFLADLDAAVKLLTK